MPGKDDEERGRHVHAANPDDRLHARELVGVALGAYQVEDRCGLADVDCGSTRHLVEGLSAGVVSARAVNDFLLVEGCATYVDVDVQVAVPHRAVRSGI